MSSLGNRVANNPLHAPSLGKEILFYVASLISLLEFKVVF